MVVIDESKIFRPPSISRMGFNSVTRKGSHQTKNHVVPFPTWRKMGYTVLVYILHAMKNIIKWQLRRLIFNTILTLTCYDGVDVLNVMLFQSISYLTALGVVLWHNIDIFRFYSFSFDQTLINLFLNTNWEVYLKIPQSASINVFKIHEW